MLPNDPDLVDILAKNGVDISVAEGDQQGNYVSLLSNLLFPLLAFGGLFFLFNRAQVCWEAATLSLEERSRAPRQLNLVSPDASSMGGLERALIRSPRALSLRRVVRGGLAGATRSAGARWTSASLRASSRRCLRPA